MRGIGGPKLKVVQGLQRISAYLRLPLTLVKIRKWNGLSGHAKQDDSARSYSAAQDDTERQNRGINDDKRAQERGCPDNRAGDAKTDADDGFQFGSAFRTGSMLASVSPTHCSEGRRESASR